MKDDIRFTTRDGKLFAWILDWPGESVTIQALAKGNVHEPRKIASVSLLGGGDLNFKQTKKGLMIDLPAAKSGDHVHGLKISFKD